MTSARTTDAPALEVAGASRRLPGRQVLCDVNLVVPRGALVAIAGPNGAGKSSLMRAIGGRLALDAGSIRIAGDEADAARRAGRLGIVPQDVALQPHLSVRENLRLWGTLAGTPRAEIAARIESALAWAGLTDRARSRVDALSGGLRRRVNLLAGILHRPDVLLLDEPTVGVDAEARTRIYALLRDLCARGMGVLLATHELEEAGQYCDTVAVLDAGRVVAAGTRAMLLAAHGGGDGEVVVVPVSAGGDEALRVLGFAAAGDGAWMSAASAVDMATLEQRLEAAGVIAAEIRLRRPTLTGVVARAIARHRECAS